MAKSIIEQSARNCTYVLKFDSLQWQEFSNLFQRINQLSDSSESDQRNGDYLRHLIVEGYRSLKSIVTEEVKCFSRPCVQLLCFNEEDWITLNEYFVISGCMADFLSQCQQKPAHISKTLMNEYLKRFKDLETRVYTILRALV